MSSTEELWKSIGLACTKTWLLPPVGKTHSHINCTSGYKMIFKLFQRKESPSKSQTTHEDDAYLPLLRATMERNRLQGHTGNGKSSMPYMMLTVLLTAYATVGNISDKNTMSRCALLKVLRAATLSIKSLKTPRCGNDLLGQLPDPLPSAAISHPPFDFL